MYVRHTASRIQAALADTPVVLVQGARQVGKSTLVREVIGPAIGAACVTLDDVSTLGAALRDPAGFLAGLPRPLVLDEVQRAPDLLLAIKAEVDRHRTPGRFILTGSASLRSILRVADVLAGRAEVVPLWPLSQGELEGVRETFVDALFDDGPLPSPKGTGPGEGHGRGDALARALLGGFPEPRERKHPDRRGAWYDSYLGLVLQREAREVADLVGLAELPRLLTVVAHRCGGLLSYAALAGDMGFNQVTLKRYFAVLQAIFLVHTVRPWTTSRVKGLMKSPKVYLVDTGLLAHLVAATRERCEREPTLAGPLLENFVAIELLKQIAWSQVRPTLLHFRDYQGHEVDFVVESPGGDRLVGVEVKAGSTVRAEDLKGLDTLAHVAGSRFHRGVILYGGDEVVPFARNVHAVPFRALWS